jgi:hypothetical protein
MSTKRKVDDCDTAELKKIEQVLATQGTVTTKAQLERALDERIIEPNETARKLAAFDDLVKACDRALTNPGPGTPSHAALLTQLRAALAKAKA